MADAAGSNLAAVLTGFVSTHVETHNMPMLEEMKREVRDLHASLLAQADANQQQMMANERRLAFVEEVLKSKLAQQEDQLRKRLWEMQVNFENTIKQERANTEKNMQALKQFCSSVEKMSETLHQKVQCFESFHKMQHFQDSLGTLRLSEQLASTEKALREKVDFKQLQQLEQLFVECLSDCHELQVGSQTHGLRDLHAALSCTDTRVASLEQTVQDSSRLEQLQQMENLLAGIQSQVACLEKIVDEKAGSDYVLQLHGVLQGVQVQVSSLEHLLERKVPQSELQELHKSLESKMGKVEEVLQGKINVALLCSATGTRGAVAQIRQLRHSVNTLQGKVTRAKQATAQGATKSPAAVINTKKRKSEEEESPRDGEMRETTSAPKTL